MPLMTRPALATLTILATVAAAPAATHAYQEPNALHYVDDAQATAPAAPQKSAADDFRAALAAPGGVAKARQIYDDAARRTRRHDLPRTELNQFGYQVLQEGRTKDAIAIFQMNVDEYPASANTYDSLSDAYLADGNNGEALQFAERTIEKLADRHAGASGVQAADPRERGSEDQAAEEEVAELNQ